MKYIVILGDGMADYAVDEFDGKTILDVANKPNIDFMSKNGELGTVKTVLDGMKPGSDVANLSVMGYDTAKCYSGRSPLEAASIGVELKENDVTFRTNLVTLSEECEFENKTMLDYSAGEITTEEAHELIKAVEKELHTDKIHFYGGVSYRHLLVWEGGSANVNLTPPHDISDKKIAQYLPKGENSEKLLELIKKSQEILKNHPINKERIKNGKNPANSIWIWGEGTKPGLDDFYDKFGLKASVISAVDLIKGIAKCANMESIDVPGATGNWDTNFDGKAKAALDSLINDDKDLVYIHMEAPDECGHQGNAEKKKLSVELIDEKVVGFLRKELERLGVHYRMLILPDHPTPICLKTHVSDPVPFVIYDSENDKGPGLSYNEKNAQSTGVYIEKGHDLMEYFIKKQKVMP